MEVSRSESPFTCFYVGFYAITTALFECGLFFPLEIDSFRFSFLLDSFSDGRKDR